MTYYQPLDIEMICGNFAKSKAYKGNKKIAYYTITIAFDIETSSFRRDSDDEPDGEKVGIMYEWTLAITDKYVIIGRTWEEFHAVIDYLVDFFGTSTDKRLMIWVHNLSFEFSFIGFRFNWENVFSLDSHKPVYAVTDTGIEFRCSYILTNMSLSMLADSLTSHKIDKLVGDLDYNLIRHSATPMNDNELNYCIHDVLIIIYYIDEQLERYKYYHRFPLTNTGVVRKYCRDECFYTSKNHHKSDRRKYERYSKLIHSMNVTEETYTMLKRAFCGGFTHAGYNHSNKIIYNVDSVDFTSSYPAVMCAFPDFPISSGEFVTIRSREEFESNLELYACLFDIEFINLQPKTFTEHYISSSKCFLLEHPVINNGRVVSAERCALTITEFDYRIIKHFYTWDSINIGKFCRFLKGYLPTDFVKSILELYKAKTELKGIPEKEDEYMLKKGMLNSAYGMTVTDILRPSHTFTTEGWDIQEPEVQTTIDKYNKSKNRFLYYAWGIWVTAIARYRLFTGISRIDGDYVYADTDSIKFTNINIHRKYLETYNKSIIKHLERAMNHHGLPNDYFMPKNIKGVPKPLGVWDIETDGNPYKIFKSLGAKRYMVYQGDVLTITVSGLNKRYSVPYILNKCNIPYTQDNYGACHVTDDRNIIKAFKFFTDEMYIPAEYTGKNIHTYGDYSIEGEVVDYLGNKGYYNEKGFVNLEPADYSLSIAFTYAQFLKGAIYNRYE